MLSKMGSNAPLCLEAAPWIHVHDPRERLEGLAALLVVHAAQPKRSVRVVLKIHTRCRLSLPYWLPTGPARGTARIAVERRIERHRTTLPLVSLCSPAHAQLDAFARANAQPAERSRPPSSTRSQRPLAVSKSDAAEPRCSASGSRACLRTTCIAAPAGPSNMRQIVESLRHAATPIRGRLRSAPNAIGLV